MIQRIQSIYLLLSAALLGGQFKVPYAHGSVTSHPVFADGLWNVIDNTEFFVLSILGILACLMAVFMFNNRKRQSNMVMVAMMLALIVTTALLVRLYLLNRSEAGLNGISLDFGLALPLAACVLIWLAGRAIRKDENLVRSMDRLR
jgi:hypothetical protein